MSHEIEKTKKQKRKQLAELDELGFNPLDLELDLSRQQLACDLPRRRPIPSLKKLLQDISKEKIATKDSSDKVSS